MTNPFEDADGVYLVLVNAENQHSLWPAEIDVPAGWSVVHGRDTRQGCLDYVEQHSLAEVAQLVSIGPVHGSPCAGNSSVAVPSL